ncbi:hypothetical protein MH215_27965 [Paenibacillus sp. ACRSA]|uniref:hypothetical protein n=1 Tax=Paenibacillus sp. ACRSA TaxID=2918211 RepID=UPI001EF6E144|nr:hypothetical protein [Paenibacillus sp. ACRSA]MCG7380824.1 hypothetical protein [Paenibacillus sp. ACRSA]
MKDKNFLELYQQLFDQLPFFDLFTIQEFTRPETEEASYLLSINKNLVSSEQEAFLLLLEKLEYLEEGLEWEETLVKENRQEVIKRILYYINKNGKVEGINSNEIIKKIEYYGGDINHESEFTNSTNTLIYDDWNLFQVLGSNETNYFLFIWYTTA